MMEKTFEDLSFKHIYLMAIIFQEAKPDREFVLKKRYDERAKNYSVTIEFMKATGLVRFMPDAWSLLPEFNDIVQRLDNSESQQAIFKRFVLDRIFRFSSVYKEAVLYYLANFDLHDGRLSFAPNAKENLNFCDVRNFLMELGFISLREGCYVIADDFTELSLSAKEGQSRFSPQELKKLLQEKEALGLAAELAVLQYERERLASRPDLLRNVRRIAEENVNAGFDIQSFDNVTSANKTMIEVKAVSVTDFEFYWSANEIQAAQSNPERYSLYLVPVVGRNKFDMARMRIIRDPFSSVFLREAKWNRQAVTYLFKENKLSHVSQTE
jgi:hypothetical protein